LAVLQKVKRAVLPKGQRLRRLPRGIGAGIRMEIDFAHQTRLFLGIYEWELNRYLRQLVVPGAPCFDVGAQYGYEAFVLARLCGDRVATFESDPVCCQGIARSLEANPDFADRVSVCNARVGVGDGALELDDFARQWGSPGFVKIDVEGDELSVLQGARALVESGKPSWIVEVHSEALERECAALLSRSGYQLKVVNPRRWLRDYRPGSHNRWLVAPRMADG
jgi:hypothetical protein